MGAETESDAVPSYLQPDKEPDLDAELSLPAAPTGHAAVPPNRQNPQVCPCTLPSNYIKCEYAFSPIDYGKIDMGNIDELSGII